MSNAIIQLSEICGLMSIHQDYITLMNGKHLIVYPSEEQFSYIMSSPKIAKLLLMPRIAF